MTIKTTVLAAILVAGLPVAVQAQETETYNFLKVGCDFATECQDFDVIYAQQLENSEISQRTRRRTRRSSSDQKIYFGLTPGVAFLGDGTNVGFGGSLFGGYKFSELIAAELEIFDYFGSLDGEGTIFDDSGYNYLGVVANAVATYPFGDDDRSIYGFGGLGVGFGRFGFTGDVADFLDDVDADSSLSGVLFNLKLGVGYPISDNIDVLGQFRYANAILDEVNNFTVEQDAITIDIGAKLKL